MLARETSRWTLKRRSDDIDEEFGEFEEDKDRSEERRVGKECRL